VPCAPLFARPQYDHKVARVESNTVDDFSKTKMAKKETQRGRGLYSGVGFAGFGGMNTIASDSSDEDELDAPGTLVKRRLTIGGVVDGSGDEDELGRPLGAGRKRPGGLRGSLGAGSLFATGLSADLRDGKKGLPEGMEVIGGDGAFEEQEDGSSALVIPEGAHIKFTLPNMSPWQLEEDGRLHKYSVLVAMRLDRLP